MEIIITYFPLIIIIIIPLAILFYRGNKGLLWILTLLYLIITGLSLRVFWGIIFYSLPVSAEPINGIIYYLPGINSVLSLSLPIFLIFLCRKEKSLSTNHKIRGRWLWFTLGVSFSSLAFLFFFFSLYLQTSVEAKNIIRIGVYSAFLLSVIGAASLFKSSKYNSPRHPNFMRWLVFPLLVVYSILTLFSMLVLIYAVPYRANGSYSFFACLFSNIIILYCLVSVAISVDYVKFKHR